jgi:hypothetical protein
LQRLKVKSMNLRRLSLTALLIAFSAVVGMSIAQDTKTDGDAKTVDGEPNEKQTDSKATDVAKEEPKKEVKKPPAPPSPKAKVPFHLQKYRVELPIVFSPSPKMGPAFRQAVIDEIVVRTGQSIGPMWNIDIIPEPVWLTPRSRVGLSRLTMDDLKPRIKTFSTVVALTDLIWHETKPLEPKKPKKSDAKKDDPNAKKAPPKKKKGPQRSLTQKPVRVEVHQPLPENLAALGSKISFLDPDVAFDEERYKLLRELMTALTGNKLEEDVADKIAQMMILYVLPIPLAVDKSYPIAIEVEGSQFTISGREWDRESEVMTTVRSRTTRDRRMVAKEVMGLLAELFHPVVQVENANPATATLRVKAGHYISSDPAFHQVAVGSLFTPFFRYLDKDRVVQKIQWLPWSYAGAKEIDRARVHSELLSGVKTPLGAFRRRRMEIRGLAIKPHEKNTTLKLAPKRNLSKPLVGYLVAAYEELPKPIPKDDEEKKKAEADPDRPKPVIYRSDRFGNVTIPVNKNKKVLWLMIRSGGALLAKFPIVPGAESHMLVECPDDTIRLDVEGQMMLLQGRLIDTIAKRSVVMAMIKSRQKKNESEKVKESLKELKSLVTFEDFKVMVEDIQLPAIEKAKKRKDTVSAGRIRSLGTQVLKVAEHHLNAEKLKEFIEEIEELEKLGPEPKE